MKKLRTKLDVKSMTGEESFMSLLHTIYGIHSKEECVLDYDQFKLSLAKLGADFFDYEIDALFNMIDIKRDKLIDIDEWVEIVC